MNTRTTNNLITALAITGALVLLIAVSSLSSEVPKTKSAIALLIVALSGISIFTVTTCLQNARVTAIDEKLKKAKTLDGVKETITDYILEQVKINSGATYYTPPEIFSNLMTQYVVEGISTIALENLIKSTTFSKESFLDAILAAIKYLRPDHLRILLDEGKIEIDTTFGTTKETLLHKVVLLFPSITPEQGFVYMDLIRFLVIERKTSRGMIIAVPIDSQEPSETAADIFGKLRSKEGALDNDDITEIKNLLNPDTPLTDLEKLYPTEPAPAIKSEPKETPPITIEEFKSTDDKGTSSNTKPETPGGKDDN